MIYSIKSILYFSILLVVTTLFSACECKNTVCFNNGSCNSGTCQCPEGYNERDYLEDCREVRGYFEYEWRNSEVQNCDRFPRQILLTKTEKAGVYSVNNASVVINSTTMATRNFNNGSQLSITDVSSDNSYSFILNLRDQNNNEIFYHGSLKLGDDYLSLYYDTTNFDEWNSCGTSQDEVKFTKNQ